MFDNRIQFKLFSTFAVHYSIIDSLEKANINVTVLSGTGNSIVNSQINAIGLQVNHTTQDHQQITYLNNGRFRLKITTLLVAVNC